MVAAQRFRKAVVRTSLVATAVAGLGVGACDARAGGSVFLGGAAGVLAFWFSTRAMGKLASISPNKAAALGYQLTAGRAILYAVVLAGAYACDPERLRSLWAAAGGLLIVRFTTVVVGVVQWRRAARASVDEPSCRRET
ncbi:MAG TPA: ATP synthase subunit I [Candidatus Hydrogenedentes bacterium]|nr:ATP synthase subunit I [Candidatus Hydrogenedentota bacterium]HPG67453.1 ATP synthase subunit I [Candidatus Hydrogenedentota bacterium]